MWSNKIRCHNNYYIFNTSTFQKKNPPTTPVLFNSPPPPPAVIHHDLEKNEEEEPIIASSLLLRVHLSDSCLFTTLHQSKSGSARARVGPLVWWFCRSSSVTLADE